MAESLSFIAGPLAGSEQPLGSWAKVTLGRSPSCDVCLEDPSVGTYHCTIERKGLLFLLSDLDGSPGTSVNEKPVKTKYLLPGDVIGLGQSRIRFNFEDKGDANRTSLTLDKGTGSIPREQAEQRVLETARRIERKISTRILPPGGDRKTGESERRVLLLAKVSQIAISETDREALFRETVTAVRERLPAERGAIVLRGREGALAPALVQRGERDEPGTRIQIHRESVRKAVSEAVATAGDAEGRTYACVPLQGRRGVHGALYADVATGGARYDEATLHLLGVVGRLLAAAIERGELEEQAAAAIREAQLAEARARDVLDAVGDAILTLDLEGVVTVANATARDILGDPAGHPFVEFVPENSQAALGEALAAARGGEAAEVELRLRPGPAAVPVRLGARVIPRRRADGTLDGLVIVATPQGGWAR
ncbi:MAG: FHA domain-containing protein [Planctomycetales bacterium]|nr:FHA domain-containing protein [Planctomycetales bacterium]